MKRVTNSKNTLPKSYKYYYSVGEFTEQSSGVGDLYDHEGYDVRSWTITDQKKEVTKEQYEKIVEEDKAIVKAFWKNFRIKIKTFHNPHKELV